MQRIFGLCSRSLRGADVIAIGLVHGNRIHQFHYAAFDSL
jgi:hypothetical protein